jgi:hypothetical protein
MRRSFALLKQKYQTMKKELTMTNNMAALPDFSWRRLRNKISEVICYKRRLRRFTILYSRIAGQPLTTGEALRILHVQISSTFLLMPCEMSLLWRIVFLLWTGLALYSCRTIQKP